MTEKPVLLAFDFGGTKLAVAIADGGGNISSREKIAVQDCSDAYDALDRAIAKSLKLLSQYSQSHQSPRLMGIGVSTMGITLPHKVIMAPNIPGWEDLRLLETFERAFPGIPIRIENDIKASALAELKRGALRNTQAGVYVNLGTGFGVALTLGDSVIRGAHGASGEMAYNLLSRSQPRGYRDGVTPLEDVVGGGGIGREASRLLERHVTSREVFQLAKTNAKARDFVERTVSEMAFHLTNLAISWDPEKAVFGGGLVSSQEWILPVIEHYFTQFVPFPPTVSVADFKSDVGLYGAIELAISVSDV